MKTIDKTHRFYDIIDDAVNVLIQGRTGFDILADRPLNHGHLVLCRVWSLPFTRISYGRASVGEYRFMIDDEGWVSVIDYRLIFRGKRRYARRQLVDHANAKLSRHYHRDLLEDTRALDLSELPAIDEAVSRGNCVTRTNCRTESQ